MQELLWLVSTDGDKIFNITEQTKIQITPTSECSRIDIYNGEKFSGTVGYFEDRNLALMTMTSIAEWLGEPNKRAFTFVVANEGALSAFIEQRKKASEEVSKPKKKGIFGKKSKK